MKASLSPLSKKIFSVAGEPYDRSSKFFEKNVRDPEYEAIVALALEAIDYAEMVLINAPFTKEVRNREYMGNLRRIFLEKGARLSIIWVKTDIAVVKKRMEELNSERDKWKLANWDEYVASCDFSIPEELEELLLTEDFFVFENSNDKEFHQSMARVTSLWEGKVFAH